MTVFDKSAALKEIPLFNGLSARERELVQERSEVAEYKKGSLIYREGSAADALYCVISGRIVIYTGGDLEHRNVLEYLHRGKYFGIISLLTGDAHSVSAEALNDSLLLVISKENFSLILKKIPRLAIDLSQTLSRRLKNKDLHQKTVFESTVISVFSSYSQVGKTMYALNLALSLRQETGKRVAILDIVPRDKGYSLPAKLEIAEGFPVYDLCLPAKSAQGFKDSMRQSRFGVDLACFSYDEENVLCVRSLLEAVSTLVNDYHYLILDLPAGMDRFVYEVLNQSDIINILSSPEEVDLKRTRNLVERLKVDFGFPAAKIRTIVNEYKLSKLTHDEQVELIGQPIYATLPKIEFSGDDRLALSHPDSEYAKAIRRIARQTGDCLVGLALGVGFAYGFCHIGVLKVIEEEHIPIDAISGSSIGAVIAGLWATGRSSEEILRITSEFKQFKYIWGFVDLTIPFLGFIKGNKLHSFLKKHFGNKTFHDVRCPLRIVASDVKHKESRVIDKGPLVDAIMASCAMPGVFLPVKFKEDMLFDGGVINPLPTEALLKMGIRKIIAVNVTPSRQDMLKEYEKIKEDLGVQKPVARRMFSLLAYLKAKFKTNILDIVFSSIEILQSEVAQKEAQLADLVIHPDTRGLHWLELHKAPEFARRGELEARKNLARIREIVSE